MSIPISTVIQWLEAWASPDLAEPDDPIGLQLGSASLPVSKISVALEVTQQVVEEAIAQGAQLIVAHHPLIYRPLRNIRTDRSDGRLIETLLAHRISVYVAHTNLDIANGGVNDMLAEAVGLKDTSPLKYTTARQYGIGRIGKLEQPLPLYALAVLIKQTFNLPALRLIGDANKMISKVAIVGGSGRSFLNHAIAASVDVYITGDIDHHTAHDALAGGITMVDPGHHVEQIMKHKLAERMNQWFQHTGSNVTAYASFVSTEPFTFV
jgi:dinuclear metal center YbgI/SA1388 family protein